MFSPTGKRKIFLPIGWGLFMLANLALIIMVKPGVLALAFLTFLSTVGYVLADVATDAMMVERSKQCERTAQRGQLQARAYISRFAGGVVGCIMGAILYNKDAWGWGLPFWGVLLFYTATPLVFIAPWYVRSTPLPPLAPLSQLSPLPDSPANIHMHTHRYSQLLELEETDAEGNIVAPVTVAVTDQFRMLFQLAKKRACWQVGRAP